MRARQGGALSEHSEWKRSSREKCLFVRGETDRVEKKKRGKMRQVSVGGKIGIK